MENIKQEIIAAICEYQDFDDDEMLEVIEAVEEIDDDDIRYNDDFFVECNGVEIRVIHNNAIESIWEEELENLLRECYEVPEFLENYIDYDSWVRDCKFDGMGHHFSSYDGSEHQSENYYYFRIN